MLNYKNYILLCPSAPDSLGSLVIDVVLLYSVTTK